LRSRVSYSLEGALYHVLISEGITYLCMADETFGRRVPFTFLEEVRRRFTSTYGAAANHVRCPSSVSLASKP